MLRRVVEHDPDNKLRVSFETEPLMINQNRIVIQIDSPPIISCGYYIIGPVYSIHMSPYSPIRVHSLHMPSYLITIAMILLIPQQSSSMRDMFPFRHVKKQVLMGSAIRLNILPVFAEVQRSNEGVVAPQRMHQNVYFLAVHYFVQVY